jgi:hypothetical protein
MVTPAAPRSRSTSAALINMLVRVEPRLAGILIAVDRTNLRRAVRPRADRAAATGASSKRAG